MYYQDNYSRCASIFFLRIYIYTYIYIFFYIKKSVFLHKRVRFIHAHFHTISE